MSNSKWWFDDDLPSSSIQQKYMHNILSSSQFLSQNHQLLEKDKILEQRLANLNVNDKNENQMETLASLEERAKMLKMTDGSKHFCFFFDLLNFLINFFCISIIEIYLE